MKETLTITTENYGNLLVLSILACLLSAVGGVFIGIAFF